MRSRIAVFFLWLILATSGGAQRRTRGVSTTRQNQVAGSVLELDKALEAGIAGEESHRYLLELAKGDFCFVSVDQRGADVAVTILSPAGRKVAEVDGSDGPGGSEFVYLIADMPGIYTFLVRSADRVLPGKYEIVLRELRPANGDDRQYLADLARTDAGRFDDSDTLKEVKARKELYPADADAKKEIEAAIAQAGQQRKRVLLVFGGNWCYDCHVLDHALHEGEAEKLMKESFLLVHVDIGEGDRNLDLAKQYKIPLEKGVPAVAILDSSGTLIYSSGDGEFEAARRMLKKDLVAFLRRWKENKPSTSGK